MVSPVALPRPSRLLLLVGHLVACVEVKRVGGFMAEYVTSRKTRSPGPYSSPLWSTMSPATASRVGEDEDFRDVKRKQLQTSPATPRVASDISPPSRGGAISMKIPELARVLGGQGRARLAWDAYSIGVDPSLFHSDVVRLGHDDFESILESLPSGRRHQRLGGEALGKLGQTYRHYRNDRSSNAAPAPLSLEGGVASLSHVSTSSDSTTKLLLKLSDGLEIEAVIIPWNGVRSTLCISSQVGCRQGCQFCATGRMGLLRPLTSDEILAQMFFAKKLCRLNNLPAITNVVFMGMGDAADNVSNVQLACEILTTRELFQLSASKVTVSTVGPTPESFSEFASTPCVLAWSVHAANDELRRRLVPTTKHTMKELREGFIAALLQRPHNFRTSMIEVVLVDGINDSVEQATELADFCREISDSVPGCKLVVNLIPYNDIGLPSYRKPSPESVDAFQRRLWSLGVYAHVRTTRGDDESAACGQLATRRRAASGHRPPAVA